MDTKEKNDLEQLFKNPDIEFLILGLDKSELDLVLGTTADFMKHDEWIYIIRVKFFGIFNKKLFLYFKDNKVHDFYLGY